MSLVPRPPDTGPRPIVRVITVHSDRGPYMVAHRGGAGLAPENTCSAIVQSSFYRPHFYEVDIRHTRDGIAVCIHDDALDRTTDLSGAVADFSFEQIDMADAGGWFDEFFAGEKIPTLDRVLDCANPDPLLIEIKERDISAERCRAIADLLAEKKDISSVIISFHREALETWREIDPDRRTGYLVREPDDYMFDGPHEMVGIASGVLTQEIVDKLQESGKAVNVYTVNENYDKFINMGVDLITTNFPDQLRKALPPG